MQRDSQKEDSTKSLERRLRVLEDKQAIHDVLMRYCRGVDRGVPDLILSAFHADAVDNHFGVALPFREAVWTIKHPLGGPMQSHNICNELVEICGDVANGETYFLMITRLEHDAKQIDWMLNGRYIDRFERREGEWRIAKRTVVYDTERFDEVEPAPQNFRPAAFTAKAVRGARGAADFSSQVLGKPDR